MFVSKQGFVATHGVGERVVICLSRTYVDFMELSEARRHKAMGRLIERASKVAKKYAKTIARIDRAMEREIQKVESKENKNAPIQPQVQQL